MLTSILRLMPTGANLCLTSSWQTVRRVAAKVEFHFGELFPRVGFIVTDLETDSRAVVQFYNTRGTAEQWIKEGLSPQNDNVLFAQSRNVLLTPSRLGRCKKDNY